MITGILNSIVIVLIILIVLIVGFVIKSKKIIIFSGSLLLVVIVIFTLIFYSNKDVKPSKPTVTFTVANNSKTYAIYYRTSNGTINGWSPFKFQFLDTWNKRILASTSAFVGDQEKTITISKKGSIYFYNPNFRYKYGGGLKINGEDITEGQTIYINSEMDIISLSGGKVYLDN